MTDKDWLEYRKSTGSYVWKKLNEEQKQYLLNRYKDNYSTEESDILKEASYRIQNNIEVSPKCPICGNICRFNTKAKYFKTCGTRKCNNILLYGSPSPFGNKDIIAKSKKTRLEKYGHEYFSNWEKSKQTCLEKYGSTSWFQSQECKDRIKEKFGVENVFANREIWEAGRQKVIEKYGGAYNKEKYKQTMLENMEKNGLFRQKNFKRESIMI